MLGCGLYCNSFIHALEEVANVSYVLGNYKEYKLIDKENNVTYKKYKTHNFNRENGNIIQRYDKTLDVLDSSDYSYGLVHNASSYLIDAYSLYKKGVEKLLEDETFFVDDPNNLIK